MNLSDLISTLIKEEGLTAEEAAKVAAATIRASRGQALANSSANAQPQHVQQYSDGVNYGHETPEQAKQRWMQQEISDPNGVFGGGASAGGVFGDGVVSMPGYDPGAIGRELGLQQQLGQMQTQAGMLQLMQAMHEELRNRAPQLPEAQQEPQPRRFGRLLGRKKNQ